MLVNAEGDAQAPDLAVLLVISSTGQAWFGSQLSETQDLVELSQQIGAEAIGAWLYSRRAH